MGTPITEMLYEEDHDLLTEKARTLTKGDLIEMSRLGRGDNSLKQSNPFGLSAEDLDSVEEAFWMHDVRDHNLQNSSMLPSDGGFITSSHAEAGGACCCCTAASGFAGPGRSRVA